MVKTIEEDTFRGCTDLEDVSLPDGLTTIKCHAFQDSAVKYVEFPPTLKRIEDSAFESCMNLKKIKLPDGL